MVILALTMALAASSAMDAPFQIFAGPTFEALAKSTDRQCPNRHVRFIKPGDIDWEEERFEETLRPDEKAKFEAAIERTADGGPKRRENRNGLSCTASANLEAIAKASLTDGFTAFVCVSKPPS